MVLPPCRTLPAYSTFLCYSSIPLIKFLCHDFDCHTTGWEIRNKGKHHRRISDRPVPCRDVTWLCSWRTNNRPRILLTSVPLTVRPGSFDCAQQAGAILHGLRGLKPLHVVTRKGATFRYLRAFCDVSARRWAAWLVNTSIDTCSFPFRAISFPLFWFTGELLQGREGGGERKREYKGWGVASATQWM